MKNCWVKYNRIQGIQFPRQKTIDICIQLHMSMYVSKANILLLLY